MVDNDSASNSCAATVTVVTNQPDLWPSGEVTGTSCTDAVNKGTCLLNGRLDLINHHPANASGDVALISTRSRTARAIKCRLMGRPLLNQMNASRKPV